MEGTIATFRRGRKTQTTNQMIILFADVDSKEKANALVGKKVSWTAPGKNKTTITGEITSAHGGNGAVRALFERGMPGQSVGTKITLN
ncbi:MAG: 50S ribosomal protein L35ae [Nanoarchaeota archaeon]|nr:50S ribosomal protein L35ae [Nanoarchaeota archaeon]